jgi:hypothetical protein
MKYIICLKEDDHETCLDEEERLKKYMEAKLEELLKALVEQYEIEVTLDPQTLKGVGRWKRKKSSQ